MTANKQDIWFFGSYGILAQMTLRDFKSKYVGRGATDGDYDNDGDPDLLIVNLNNKARLLRNDGGNKGRNWLTVTPRLAKTKAIALCARVTVTAGGRTLREDVLSSNGYLSRSDPRAHFGLGDAKKVDRVEIRWPNGSVTKRENVKVNQILDVVQETK